MKSFEVTYKKGHLIDVNTGKRIFLKRGGRFNILADDDQFEERDELTIETEILGSSEKKSTLKSKFRGYFLEKIADAGQSFSYRIGLSKVISEDVKSEFHFDAVILEDLYIKSKDGENWSMCDCQCETTHCLSGSLQMIESVRGYSLSNLFSNMVAFYFSQQRSGACNAFTTFYFMNREDYNPNLLHLGCSLDTKRKLIKNKYKEPSEETA